jgi:hypothetical protein
VSKFYLENFEDLQLRSILSFGAVPEVRLLRPLMATLGLREHSLLQLSHSFHLLAKADRKTRIGMRKCPGLQDSIPLQGEEL